MATRLIDLPDSVFYCLRGAKGHDFEEVHLGRNTEWGTPVDSRCTRCGKVRHDVIDSLGNLSVRHYEPRRGYPGYPDVEAFETTDVRRELVRRARARARARLRSA